MRRTRIVFGLLAAGTATLALASLHARITTAPERARMARSAALVRAVGLTDLALFTEARFTRNPALADLQTAFQDAPMSFEHFPSGTFAPRPAAGFGRGELRFGPEEAAR
ncbi:hypothetical protein [Aliiruegeria lutimaris]|uniref:Uncharacterized protein n=1 Tax=Aliiruegeria lutimaris TaxID=571298 RepID=A0A1G8YTX3_9RHOB|nr:hypothetical protein [Aliiruegeria lutimaris]SDK06312.1 hypothetical protein SAMN04488026_103021 [Aliiruegeria lutimaris]